MKGYKTVGPPKVSQRKSYCSPKEYERFWNRQREKELRKQAKTTGDKKAGEDELVLPSLFHQEKLS